MTLGFGGRGRAWITEGHTTAHSEILGVDSLYLYRSTVSTYRRKKEAIEL